MAKDHNKEELSDRDKIDNWIKNNEVTHVAENVQGEVVTKSSFFRRKKSAK